MVPTKRCIADTKLQEAVREFFFFAREVDRSKSCWFEAREEMENLLWVREVVVYLLVEDVEYDVQEVPVR
jgi:hypothetical protein